MPLAHSPKHLSIEDYLAGEAQSTQKHEYVEGQVYAMAGASLNHNRITRNLLVALSQQLAGQPCEAFSSDMMIQTAKDRFRYPDLVVLCEPHLPDSGASTVAQNPVLIVEVLSKSTRQQDKGSKRMEYLALPSLQEYLLIEQDFVEVELIRRSQGWRPENYYLGQALMLESIPVCIEVSAIYQQVDNEDMLQWLTQQQEQL